MTGPPVSYGRCNEHVNNMFKIHFFAIGLQTHVYLFVISIATGRRVTCICVHRGGVSRPCPPKVVIR